MGYLNTIKNEIIKEIMDLRTLVGEIETKQNEDKVHEIQVQINNIHDKVFEI